MKYKIILYTLIAILLFTLPFKFGIVQGPLETTYPKIIPLVIGMFEFSAVMLLVSKAYRIYGAFLAGCIFLGAIGAHIFVLGIGYGKVLFPLALIGALLALYIFRYEKR